VSTQEIDFTAGTDSHPNDPQVDTPGRVPQVAVPPAARTLSTLSHIDYEDAFLVETGPAQDRTGERWARAILEDAPIIMRSSLRWGWFALGLQLGSTRSDRHVLGWEVRRGSSDVALLGASSRLGLPAELLCRRQRQAPAAGAALRHLRATGEPHRTGGVARSHARASTGRAVRPRAGQPQDS
jgi:hypothetical protein